jgi:hypothetical protein
MKFTGYRNLEAAHDWGRVIGDVNGVQRSQKPPVQLILETGAGREEWPVTLALYSWLQRGVDSIINLTSLVIRDSLMATIQMVRVMIAMQRYWPSGVTMGSLK